HPHHLAVRHPAVGPEVDPGGLPGLHQGAEGGAEVGVAELGVIHEDPAAAVHRHHHALLRLEGPGLRLRQLHVHPALHDRRGDHEDDEEHEGHVDHRGDVDVGVERQLAPVAPEPQRHQMRPSRAMDPISSLPNPSSSLVMPRTRATKRLYPMTAGIAAKRPATVVTRASATPGATALMLPEPLAAIPMKASITPSTVPRSPSSGPTEPIVASAAM